MNLPMVFLVILSVKSFWPRHSWLTKTSNPASWCFQPISKICSSNWLISPGRGENKPCRHGNPHRHITFLWFLKAQVASSKALTQTWVFRPFGEVRVNTGSICLFPEDLGKNDRKHQDDTGAMGAGYFFVLWSVPFQNGNHPISKSRFSEKFTLADWRKWCSKE